MWKTLKMMVAVNAIFLFWTVFIVWVMGILDVIKLSSDLLTFGWFFMMFLYYAIIKPISKSFAKKFKEKEVRVKQINDNNVKLIEQRRTEINKYIEENAGFGTYDNGKEYVVFDDDDEDDIALAKALADYVKNKYRVTKMTTATWEFPDIHPSVIAILNREVNPESSILHNINF